jgi:hypothetical protein
LSYSRSPVTTLGFHRRYAVLCEDGIIRLWKKKEDAKSKEAPKDFLDLLGCHLVLPAEETIERRGRLSR